MAVCTLGSHSSTFSADKALLETHDAVRLPPVGSDAELVSQAVAVPHGASDLVQHLSSDNNIDDYNDSKTDESDAVRRNAERLADPDGRQVYAQRSSSVETVLCILRSAMKFNEFHLRGMRKVNAEWKLVCAAWNLKRMHRLQRSSAPS